MSSSTSSSVLSMAESVSWFTSLLLAFMLAMSFCQGEEEYYYCGMEMDSAGVNGWRDGAVRSKPCDDIYVVGERETLHSIGEKCGDPYIVENNPHIHDPDDVFPGLVIKITPFQTR